MNGVLVGEGLARWDQRTAPGSTTLRNLENGARRARRGLWAARPDGPGRR
ncbi:MAG: hypothetical protein ACRC1K_02705 [Planctomycetia bacterium]